MARLAAVPDLTLRALVVELGERGVVTSYGSVWRIVHDARITFKKNSVRHRTRSSGRRAKTRALEDPSGPT
jgi:transposase